MNPKIQPYLNWCILWDFYLYELIYFFLCLIWFKLGFDHLQMRVINTIQKVAMSLPLFLPSRKLEGRESWNGPALQCVYDKSEITNPMEQSLLVLCYDFLNTVIFFFILSIYYMYPIANWACYWFCRQKVENPILVNVDKTDSPSSTQATCSIWCLTSHLWLGWAARGVGNHDFILLDTQIQI